MSRRDIMERNTRKYEGGASMRKRIPLLLALAGTCLCVFTGCEKQTGLTIEAGSLLWDEVQGAVEYQITMDDSIDNCQEPSWDLSHSLQYAGTHQVSVVAVLEDGKEQEVGTMEVVAENLQAPSLAVVDNEDKTKSFVWSGDEHVAYYEYDLNDGTGRKKIEAGEENLCKVEFPGDAKTMITVEAAGTSDGNTVYLDSEVNYEFEGTKIFNFAKLAEYPFYFTSRGTGGLEKFSFGTTLKKGAYVLDVTMYVMDSNGNTVTGNGLWGRRITDRMADTWFCNTDVDGWPGSGGTIPESTTATTKKLDVNVNKYGEAVISMGDFKANEMVVIADVRYQGKSVMAKKAAVHKDEKVETFDTSDMSKFITVFRSPGDWMTEDNKESYEMKVPVSYKNGIYKISMEYQLMDANGAQLSGNGLWGRRITDETMSDMIWCTEYDVESYKGMDDMPSPKKVLKGEFMVTVKDGQFKLLCLDFNIGEMVAVKSVKKLSGSDKQFPINTLSSYKNVFKSIGVENTESGYESFRVETTLKQRMQVEVEVTYYAMSGDGMMLTGNGSWGRRIMDEGTDEIWLCSSAPEKRHADAEGTIPDPTKPVKRKMTVTLNKKGRFFLDMYDFQKGEIVVIKDITYNGKSILKK